MFHDVFLESHCLYVSEQLCTHRPTSFPADPQRASTFVMYTSIIVKKETSSVVVPRAGSEHIFLHRTHVQNSVGQRAEIVRLNLKKDRCALCCATQSTSLTKRMNSRRCVIEGTNLCFPQVGIESIIPHSQALTWRETTTPTDLTPHVTTKITGRSNRSADNRHTYEHKETNRHNIKICSVLVLSHETHHLCTSIPTLTSRATLLGGFLRLTRN